MSNAYVIATQSLQHDLQRLEGVSQNLVNAMTPGYRRSVTVQRPFSATMQLMQPDAVSMNSASAVSVLPALKQLTDLRPSGLHQTGNPLDFAVTGEGWFELLGENGPVYTRDGRFHLDKQNRLVSQQGLAVQGVRGDIVIPAGGFTVKPDGSLMQGEQLLGQLKIVNYMDGYEAVRMGESTYQLHGEPKPAGSAEWSVQNGFLENANVTHMQEMVTMLETTRHFEMLQRLIQGYDDSQQKAIQKLGEF